MNNLIDQTPSAYAYPLLIKQLFLAPMVNNPNQEIVYRDQLNLTYKTWKDCEAKVKGKRGVKFKKITTSAMELQTYRDWGIKK